MKSRYCQQLEGNNSIAPSCPVVGYRNNTELINAFHFLSNIFKSDLGVLPINARTYHQVQSILEGITEVVADLPASNINHRVDDYESQSFKGVSLLTLAAILGESGIIKILLDRHADANQEEEVTGLRPLHFACAYHQLEIIQLLLQHKDVEVNVSVPLFSPLSICSAFGEVEGMRLLIERKANIDHRDSSGSTPLINALVFSSNVNGVMLLIEEGANVGAVNAGNISALFKASEKVFSSTSVVLKALTDRGADCNQSDTNGLTPLAIACVVGNTEAVDYLLISKCADTSIADVNRTTPLLHAVLNKHEKVVEILLKHGTAQINQVNHNGRTALHVACYSKLGNILAMLVQHDSLLIDPVDTSDIAATPLHYCSASGEIDGINLLLARGAKIEHKDKDGNTPLMNGLKNEHAALLLVEHGADVNAINNAGISVLIYAIMEQSSVSTVKMLLENGADYNYTDPAGGMNAFMRACFNGNVEVVRYMLESGYGSSNFKDHEGTTPLWRAAWGGSVPVIKMLLNNSLGMLNEADIYGGTPLHVACFKSPDAVKLLLKYDTIDINSLNVPQGRTPLHMCSAFSNIPGMQYLIEKGADIDHRDSYGGTPLLNSIIKDPLIVDSPSEPDVSAALWLVDNGADVNASDNDAYSAFSYACGYTDSPALLRALVEKGADYNYTNPSNGMNCLMLACKSNRRSVVQFLLDHKYADISARNLEGKTAVYWVAMEGHFEMMQLLLEKGGTSQLDIGDANGNKPLDVAWHHGHLDIVFLIWKYNPYMKIRNPDLRRKLSDPKVVTTKNITEVTGAGSREGIRIRAYTTPPTDAKSLTDTTPPADSTYSESAPIRSNLSNDLTEQINHLAALFIPAA